MKLLDLMIIFVHLSGAGFGIVLIAGSVTLINRPLFVNENLQLILTLALLFIGLVSIFASFLSFSLCLDKKRGRIIL